MSWTLKSRLLIPTLAVVSVGLVVVSAVSYLQSRKTIVESITQEMSQICTTGVSHLDDWFHDKQVNLEGWASLKVLQTSLQDSFVGRSARASASGELVTLIKRYDYFEQLHLLDVNGVAVASSDANAIGQLNLGQEPWFKTVMQGQPAFSDAVASKTTGKPIIIVTAPVKDGDKIAGVLAACLDYGVYAEQFISPIIVQTTGYVYVYDKRGLILAHPDKANLLKLNLSDYDWGREMLGKPSGEKEYTFAGIEKIAIFHTSPQMGLSLCATLPTVELLSSVRRTGLITLIIGVVTLLATVGVILLVVRSVTRPLDHGIKTLMETSNHVASAAEQISSSSQSLAEGASEQAASLEETSSSLEEMSSMTQRNAAHAQKANELSKATRAAADSGASEMQEMTTAMAGIKSASDNISKILKTIDEIAFQTNILALNAAVEAARAGEAGMGFAVVADEVRNLAQRAASAARETGEKIADSVTKSERAVAISSRVAIGLQEIVAKARQVDELVAEIATASKEQSQGITQINTTVSQMDKITQSNAANAEESASSAQELNALAETLKGAVSDLEHLVTGNTDTSAATSISPYTKNHSVLRATPVPTLNGQVTRNGHQPTPVSAHSADLTHPHGR
ncbi:MAG: methyl-accepting chemotaxis protein [Verrucomicrobiota bacterium]|nr:methyl-accepting chemotaxis protein [Verrucomicrobiota bacterium]